MSDMYTIIIILIILLSLRLLLPIILLLSTALTLLGIFVYRTLQYIKYRFIKNIINQLTTTYLPVLKDEDKKTLAKSIDEYQSKYSQLKQNVMEDLSYLATGYTISDLGFTRVVRYGLGYVLIRRLLKKHLHKNEKEKAN
ncbi:MAG: hypothetical protein DRO67_03210 [Candidatus Asgardarchaeum californiense]|nr:MAG: hypothetical protein DRO67_03210 [Candidatus Asgardarchaeum californiense]